MTAATVTTKHEGNLASDFATLECSNGETYVSKLSKPLVAFCSVGSASISSRTITISLQGADDQTVHIGVFGRL